LAVPLFRFFLNNDLFTKKNIVMETIKKKTLNKPEEVRQFPKGQVELVTIDGITFGKGTFQPGWKWSESVKPIAKTDSCQAAHTQYHISGRLHVKMDDGTEKEYGPGDVGVVPPGHDAWVVGNEPAVMIDFTGMTQYAVAAVHEHAHAEH
jgi:hypothetical protein